MTCTHFLIHLIALIFSSSAFSSHEHKHPSLQQEDQNTQALSSEELAARLQLCSLHSHQSTQASSSDELATRLQLCSLHSHQSAQASSSDELATRLQLCSLNPYENIQTFAQEIARTCPPTQCLESKIATLISTFKNTASAEQLIQATLTICTHGTATLCTSEFTIPAIQHMMDDSIFTGMDCTNLKRSALRKHFNHLPIPTALAKILSFLNIYSITLDEQDPMHVGFMQENACILLKPLFEPQPFGKGVFSLCMIKCLAVTRFWTSGGDLWLTMILPKNIAMATYISDTKFHIQKLDSEQQAIQYMGAIKGFCSAHQSNNGDIMLQNALHICALSTSMQGMITYSQNTLSKLLSCGTHPNLILHAQLLTHLPITNSLLADYLGKKISSYELVLRDIPSPIQRIHKALTICFDHQINFECTPSEEKGLTLLAQTDHEPNFYWENIAQHSLAATVISSASGQAIFDAARDPSIITSFFFTPYGKGALTLYWCPYVGFMQFFKNGGAKWIADNIQTASQDAIASAIQPLLNDEGIVEYMNVLRTGIQHAHNSWDTFLQNSVNLGILAHRIYKSLQKIQHAVLQFFPPQVVLLEKISTSFFSDDKIQPQDLFLDQEISPCIKELASPNLAEQLGVPITLKEIVHTSTRILRHHLLNENFLQTFMKIYLNHYRPHHPWLRYLHDMKDSDLSAPIFRHLLRHKILYKDSPALEREQLALIWQYCLSTTSQTSEITQLWSIVLMQPELAQKSVIANEATQSRLRSLLIQFISLAPFSQKGAFTFFFMRFSAAAFLMQNGGIHLIKNAFNQHDLELGLYQFNQPDIISIIIQYLHSFREIIFTLPSAPQELLLQNCVQCSQIALRMMSILQDTNVRLQALNYPSGS